MGQYSYVYPQDSNVETAFTDLVIVNKNQF